MGIFPSGIQLKKGKKIVLTKGFTLDRENLNIINHSVDSYEYTFAKNSNGDFDIIGKEYISDAITGLLERGFDE